MSTPFRSQRGQPDPFWFYATDYLNPEQAELARQRVHTVAHQYRIPMAVNRIEYRNLLQIVIVQAFRRPDEANQQRIIQALHDGHALALPSAFRAEMEAELAETLRQIRSGQPRTSVFEPGERSRTFIEFPQPDIERHLDVLRNTFAYFIDFYWEALAFNLSFRLQSPNGAEYLSILRNQLSQADIYEFTDSARAMHQAVFEDSLAWIPWQADIWIQHDQPDSLFPGALIKAIFVNKVDTTQVYEEYRHPWWNITAVDPRGQHLLTMLYDGEAKTYDPTSDYICPWSECVDMQGEVKGGYLIARQCCPRCRERADALAKWLHTALRQLRRDFAVRADPPPFEKAEMVTREKRAASRRHEQGKLEEHVVETRRSYTIVAYEVSLAERRTVSLSEAEGEKRQSWLSLHGKEHRVYKLLSIPDYERDYTGPHWERLIARCLAQLPSGQPGPVILDGVEYQVTFAEGDGTPVVTRTINVPNGRYTPYLKSEYKKQPTIKKAIAQQFYAQVTELQQIAKEQGE